MIVKCTHCGKDVEKSTGHYNRSVKLGLRFYCDRKCRGQFKQTSVEQKKAVKAAYDRNYRNTEKRKATAKAYNESPAGRAMQKRQREKKKQYHNEYCRQADYVAWKKQYDQVHKAKKHYGEFWECAILTEQINNTLIKMADKAEIRTIQGTNTKSKRRKRQWLKPMKNLPQLT